MKKILLTSSLFLSANASAHVSTANNVQHASEHLLLGILLVPVAWLIARKFLSK